MWRTFAVSEPFEQCINERQNYKAYGALHEGAVSIVRLLAWADLRSACAVHIANKYNGAIAALSGIAVAIFTFTLYLVTGRAAKISLDQIELARQEFYIVHRPRLRIRNAELKHGQTVIELPDGIKPVHKIGLIYGEPIECHFTVANVGGTTATIIECDAYLVQTPVKLTGRPYDGRNPPDVQPLTPGTKIDASGSRRAFFVDLAGLSEIMVTSLTADAQGDHPKSIPKLSLYLIGYVRYADATGAKRRTAFCRLYDITERRFKRLAEPDEDYENEE